MADEDEGTPVNLRADGLLWLINRTTFHPRGFALGLSSDGTFVLFGDGSEVWRFDESINEDWLFAASENCFARQRPVFGRSD